MNAIKLYIKTQCSNTNIRELMLDHDSIAKCM